MTSITEISQRLAGHTEAVCAYLLPAGKITSGRWEVGGINGDTGKSLKVTLNGDHAGHWTDFADNARGDLIDLWEQTRNCDKFTAIKEAKAYLGIHDPENLTPKRYKLAPDRPELKPLNATGKAMQYLAVSRKIEPSIVNRFKIVGDEEKKAIVFPSYGPSGVLVNRSYVKLERDDKGNKVVWQDKECAPCLWGWQGLDESAMKAREILICEGQIDAMTWTQWGVNALSIPNGSGRSWIEYEWDNLAAFATIYLSYDTDGKSDENLRETIKRLGIHRCRIVKLPHKDANDALKAGCCAEDARKWLHESKWSECQGVSEAKEFIADTVEEFYPSPDKDNGFKVKFLKRLDGEICFRPAEITVWTGVAGHGKTTLLSFIMSLAVLNGKRVMFASMEMKPSKILKRIVQGVSGVALPTIEEINGVFDATDSRILFINKIGYIARTELLEMMRFSYSRYGAKQFVIDSLMRVQGLEEDYPAQGDFMNELARFVKDTDSHVHLVCHPRKMSGEGVTPGKLDIKGSSLIANNCDNVIAVQRNMEKANIRRERALTTDEDSKMPDTFVTVEKQRETGWEGRFELRFDFETGRFSSFR